MKNATSLAEGGASLTPQGAGQLRSIGQVRPTPKRKRLRVWWGGPVAAACRVTGGRERLDEQPARVVNLLHAICNSVAESRRRRPHRLRKGDRLRWGDGENGMRDQCMQAAAPVSDAHATHQ